jgi:S1-C subfamily serine protease
VVNVRSFDRVNEEFSESLLAGGKTLSWFGFIRGFLNYTFRDVYQVKSVGSGIVLNRKGYILTNHHLVEDGERIFVQVNGRREYKAQLVGTDPLTDLAVLKIPGGFHLAPAVLGDSDRVEVGEWVMSIGNPFGLQPSMTIGIVSGINRIHQGWMGIDGLIQTDAPLNPGNNGGPLLNLRGQVIGMNTEGLSSSQRVGFSIPINTGLRLARHLIRNGTVERGWLGLGMQQITPILAEALHLPAPEGAIVNQVFPNAPSEKAGIRPGDVIVWYDGHPVRSPLDLRRRITETRVGTQVDLGIFRKGNLLTRKATVGSLTGYPHPPKSAKDRPR